MLRFHLDPFNEHSDYDIWEALKQSYLKSVIAKNPMGLYAEVWIYIWLFVLI